MAGAFRRGKWLSIGLALAVVGGGVTWGLIVSRSQVNADPGGKILQAISTVRVALPSDAKARLLDHHEPGSGACGATHSGPMGWTDAQVSYQFTTHISPTDLVTLADASMRAAGWTTTGNGTWARQVVSGTASATLTPFDGPQKDEWDLGAEAPALCH